MKGQLGGGGCRSARMSGVIAQRDVDQLCSGQGGIGRGVCDDTRAGFASYREETSRGAVGAAAPHLVATEEHGGERASVVRSGEPHIFKVGARGGEDDGGIGCAGPSGDPFAQPIESRSVIGPGQRAIEPVTPARRESGEGVGRDAADRRGAIGEGVGRKDAREIGVASVGARARSEERRVGKSVSVRVDLGGRRIIKKKKNSTSRTNFNDTSRSNMVCKR